VSSQVSSSAEDLIWRYKRVAELLRTFLGEKFAYHIYSAIPLHLQASPSKLAFAEALLELLPVIEPYVTAVDITYPIVMLRRLGMRIDLPQTIELLLPLPQDVIPELLPYLQSRVEEALQKGALPYIAVKFRSHIFAEDYMVGEPALAICAKKVLCHHVYVPPVSRAVAAKVLERYRQDEELALLSELAERFLEKIEKLEE